MTRSNTVRLSKNQKVTLEELDQLLDFTVQQFDRGMRRLVKTFRDKAICIDFGTAKGCQGGLDLPKAKVAWTRHYEAEVRRLPRMERKTEFLMARRHEFVRARVEMSLRDLGYTAEQATELSRRPFEKIPGLDLSAQGGAVRPLHRHLLRCMLDYERLRNIFVEGALYLVAGCAYRYRGLGVDLPDLIQEGNASLFQAIEGFDWRRDVRFKTYARYWIHQAILKTLYNSSRTVRIPIWVQKTLGKVRRLREKGHPITGEPMSDADIARELDMPAKRLAELLETKRSAISIDASTEGDGGGSLAGSIPDENLSPVDEVVEIDKLGECLEEVMAELPDRERSILTRRFGLRGAEPETLGEIASDLGITAERVRQLQNAALSRLQRPAARSRLIGFV